MRSTAIALGIATVLLPGATGCGDDGSSDTGAGQSSTVTGTGGGAGQGGGGTGGGGGGGAPTLVETAAGPVQGYASEGVRGFLGIPYAAPPVGPLRWRPPQAHEGWDAPIDATKAGPRCTQNQALGDGFDASSSEDCLTLNVWTPSGSTTEKRPVMVWIHGGGFSIGSANDPMYDGTQLAAKRGVVVVGMNYRLGPLGFLSHAALAGEDPEHPTSGNYGLLDQRIALAWVRDNIAAFGGDPDNVTIFGESAGGASVCTHLLSGAKGLFHRAIIQSGPCRFPSGKDQAEQQGEALAAALGCDAEAPLECLRGKTNEEVLGALPGKKGFFFGDGVTWAPHRDGVVLPADPEGALEAGALEKVPVIVGSNGDEGTIFLQLAGLSDIDEAGYEAIVADLASQLGADDPGPALAQYPVADYDSPAAALSALIGEGGLNCQARRVARAAAKGGAPVFLYHFTYPLEVPFFPDAGAFHSAEIPFVFGTRYITTTLSEEELPLSDAMMGYWARLAATGDPNGDGAVEWSAYTTDGDAHLGLDLSIEPGTGLRKEKCDFWDTYLP